MFVSAVLAKAEENTSAPAAATIPAAFPMPAHYFGLELERSQYFWGGRGTHDEDGHLSLSKANLQSMMAHLVDLYLEPWMGVNHSASAPASSNTTLASTPVTTFTSADFDDLELELRTNAIRVQIFDGQVMYRDVCNVSMQQEFKATRSIGQLRIFQHIATRLRSTNRRIEFFVSYLDHPKFTDNSMTNGRLHNFPYFALHSTPRAYSDILVPDPLDIGDRYDSKKNGNRPIPYGDRIDKVFFRGSFSPFKPFGKDLWSNGRVRAHKLGDQFPHLFDTGLVSISSSRLGPFANFSEMMGYINSIPRAKTDIGEANKYKFQLDVDGGLGSGRAVNILKSGSVLLKVMSPFQQFADPLLIPFKHYIPVDQHMHYLVPIVKWCIENPTLMETITRNAVEFASQFHSIDGRSLFWNILLEKYAGLMEAPHPRNKRDKDKRNRAPFEPVPENLCKKYEATRQYCPAMITCYSGWKNVP